MENAQPVKQQPNNAVCLPQCRWGYKGFYDRKNKPIVLNRKVVEDIQLQGGTMLGTSRGGADIKEIVKRIDMWGIDMLFVVGGNGGNAGANAIHDMCVRDGVNCSVVGIPKSIDNDILLVRNRHPALSSQCGMHASRARATLQACYCFSSASGESIAARFQAACTHFLVTNVS